MSFSDNIWYTAIVLMLCPAGLPAQDAAQSEESDSFSGPWAIGLSGHVDDDSNDGAFLTFNWGLSERTWISFAGGRSRSPSERADVSADTLIAGADHRFGLFGVTFEAESWGDDDAVESDDLGGSVYIQRERFRLALTAERRDIDIHFTTGGLIGRPVQRTASLTADGTGLSLRVQLAERWQLYLASTGYDYSRNLSLLPRVQDLNLLSTSALTLANSFVDRESMLGVEWELGTQVLNLSLMRDRSAADGSSFESVSFGYLFPVSRRVDLELSIGKSSSDLFQSSLYGGVLLLIYGGG